EEVERLVLGGVARHEHGRHAARDAEHRAGLVRLAAAGLHRPQVTFRVDDLALEGDVLREYLRRGPAEGWQLRLLFRGEPAHPLLAFRQLQHPAALAVKDGPRHANGYAFGLFLKDLLDPGQRAELALFDQEQGARRVLRSFSRYPGHRVGPEEDEAVERTD